VQTGFAAISFALNSSSEIIPFSISNFVTTRNERTVGPALRIPEELTEFESRAPDQNDDKYD